MIFQTEKRDQFIEYVLSKRPDLLRRETQLKLEGDLNTVTENRDKFILFENCTRPPLAKRNSNLFLEGDFYHLPEYKDVFVEFPRHRPVTKRPDSELHIDREGTMNVYSETLSQFIEHALSGAKPELQRKPSNLKCEGDLDFLPEYTKSFQQFPIERRPSLRQNPHLKLEGELYVTPEYKDKYTSLPLIKQVQTKQPDGLMFNDDILKHEMKNLAYVPSHADSQNLLVNPEDSLPVSTGSATKTERPPTARRAASPQVLSSDLRPYLDSYKTMDTKSRPPKSPKPPEERLTGRPPKGRTSRPGSGTRRDYYQRVDHTEPPFEVLGKINPGEEKRTDSTKDGNAFLYKPSSRRGSITGVHSPRRRSDSPSYRLHVTNVDEPKKGFGARNSRRTTSKEYRNSEHKPPKSPIRTSQQREASVEIHPSQVPRQTARRQWAKNNFADVEHAGIRNDHYREVKKSFVVLDQSSSRKQAPNITSPWFRHSED